MTVRSRHQGGDVLDPSQALRGRRDIGIRWGVIEAIENEIPAARASRSSTPPENW
jgi:dihydroorotase